MGEPTTVARRRIGARLRELREATGENGTEFAGRLGAGWSQSRVSRFETGARLPTDGDMQTWAAATGAGVDELLTLLERARREVAIFGSAAAKYAAAGGPDLLQDALAAIEQAATYVACYQPATILGLCQTATFAGELLRRPGSAIDSGASEAEIQRMVGARLRRQAILYEPGREVVLLMGEAALRVQVVSPATMREQLDHLARLAIPPMTATLGVVPFSALLPVAPMAGWAIRDDVVTIETNSGDLELTSPADVQRYRRYTSALLEVAVTGAAAAELCRDAAATLEPS